LRLLYDELLSSFAFDINLRRYYWATAHAAAPAGGGGGTGRRMAGGGGTHEAWVHGLLVRPAAVKL